MTESEIEEAIEPGEKIIGEMNDLEKGLMILCMRYSATEKKLVDQFRSTFENDKEIVADKFEKMEAELEKTRGRFKIVHKFLWKSIQENNFNADKGSTCGLAARSGFKIVTMPKGKLFVDDLMGMLKNEEKSIDSLAGLVEGLMMMGGPTGAGMQIPGVCIRIR